MKCPICSRENTPEAAWCAACGASLGTVGTLPHALASGTELHGGSYLVIHVLAQGGYLERMGSALEVVHGAGLLHRDLKPSNVMVTDDGRVVLIDFGTAREYASGPSVSHSTTLTAGYAPLEQYSRHGLRGRPRMSTRWRRPAGTC